MLQYRSCFNEPTIGTRGVLPFAENASHTDNETYHDLKEEIILVESNLVTGSRHTLNLDAVDHTLNADSSLKKTLPHCSAVLFICYCTHFSAYECFSKVEMI